MASSPSTGIITPTSMITSSTNVLTFCLVVRVRLHRLCTSRTISVEKFLRRSSTAHSMRSRCTLWHGTVAWSIRWCFLPRKDIKYSPFQIRISTLLYSTYRKSFNSTVTMYYSGIIKTFLMTGPRPFLNVLTAPKLTRTSSQPTKPSNYAQVMTL